MILDVEKFIRARRSEWNEFEAMVALLESSSRAKLDMDEAQRYHIFTSAWRLIYRN